MEDKEFEMKMLKKGINSEVITRKLKEAGYIKKVEPEELSQGLREFYEKYFNSILRDIKNVFQ